jgi:hypothetical protein
MKRLPLVFAASMMFLAAGCKDQTPPLKAPTSPPPATPAPATPSPSGQTVDGGAKADARLGMMERYEIWKAKKEAAEKLAADLLAKERARLIKFDMSKLPKHLAMFEFEKKTRVALDEAATKLNGQLDASDQLKKLAASQAKPIAKHIKELREMDPKGDSSAIGSDHDVVLNLLVHDYPAAILAFFQGQTKSLAEVRAEMDKREKNIAWWLSEVEKEKEAGKAKPTENKVEEGEKAGKKAEKPADKKADKKVEKKKAEKPAEKEGAAK